MIPTLSNTADKGCSPVSSNCVIWQGPDLPMLSLCNGDSVSEVIHKLAQYIVNSGQADLDIDLSCLTSSNVTDMSVQNIITLLIAKVCTLQDLVSDLGAGDTVPDPLLTIAQCFRTTDAYGDPITQKQHTEYTGLIGLKVCEINTTVAAHVSTLASYGNRLTVLEAALSNPATPTSTVTLTCSGTGTPLSYSTAILNLENQICTLRNATGTATALTQAASAQCASLATSPALSKTGTMSAIPGWKTTVSTAADSLTNLWLTVCDLRDALISVKGLVKADCSSVVVDFAVALINNGTAANLFFSGYSSIPSGWTNCVSTGSKLTIQDALGNKHLVNVDVISAANNSAPLILQLDGTPLNLATALTFTLEACLTNSGITCNKTVIKSTGTSTNVCPNIIVTPSTTVISFSFEPPVNNNVSYRIELQNAAGVLIANKTFSNPQGVISDSFINLVEGNVYKIRAVVTVGNLPAQECPFASYTTINTGSNTCGVPPTIVSATLS